MRLMPVGARPAPPIHEMIIFDCVVSTHDLQVLKLLGPEQSYHAIARTVDLQAGLQGARAWSQDPATAIN